MIYRFEDFYDEDDGTQLIPLLDGNDAQIDNTKLNSGDTLGVLPLKNMVLFPGVLLPVTVSRPRSQKLVTKTY